MLNSTRLTLKKPTLADAPDMAKYLNRKDTAHMMSHVPYPYTLDDAHEFITGTTATIQTDLFNAIYNKSNDFMGIIGILPKSTGDEIAYWLGHPFWGKGYMTEAATLIVNEYFKVTDKNELFVTHLLTNNKSESVIQKLGFIYTGDVTLDIPTRKTAEKAKRYKLTRQDWKAKHEN